MKTIKVIAIVFLMSVLPLAIHASQQSTRKSEENTWTGTIITVNARDNMLTAKHWWLTKTFRLGEHCAIATLDKQSAALSDLRPGERVQVRYQNAEGVLVADRIAEKSLRFAGAVHAVDQKTATLTMEQTPLEKPFHSPMTFHIANDCKVMLPNGHEGTLADVQPGDRISVIYELPDGAAVAFRIRDRSSTFTGTVDAIDLSASILKTKEMFGQKGFDLADHCQILLDNGKLGHLKDLTLGQRYKFTFEDVNGVNVLNRVAPVQEAKAPEMASTK